jgi:DNA modification methylase
MSGLVPQSRPLQVEYLPIDHPIVDPENARLHKPAQVRQIAESIKAFDFNAPILLDRNLRVLAGHGRLLACRKLGRKEIPVIRLEHLTEAQARAYAIADNRLSETSEWSEQVLAFHLKTLSELNLDFSLEATGFSMTEIDLRIESLELDSSPPVDPDEGAQPSGPAVCQPGDLWVLGDHRVLCASALFEASYDQLLGDDRVAAVFADPPYNVPINGHVSGLGKRKHREFAAAVGEMDGPEFTAFLVAVCRLAAAYSTQASVHFWCMDWRHLQHLLAAGQVNYSDLLNICVWAKDKGGMGTLYRSAHELVAVFRNGSGGHRNNVQLGRFGRNRTNVWSYPGANSFLRSSEEGDLLAQHPTPKPTALVADALLDVTARRDLVLDPFLGSGSSLMAAERISRRCRGLELDPLYVDLTIRRWTRLTGGDAVLERTGESFAALEAQA